MMLRVMLLEIVIDQIAERAHRLDHALDSIGRRVPRLAFPFWVGMAFAQLWAFFLIPLPWLATGPVLAILVTYLWVKAHE
ncbi:MAG: hypothetical protein F4Z78_10620 [Gammaproteobacteria bacterium]|nr:hypothetical protein [Gammaproteobacteria bacterium]